MKIAIFGATGTIGQQLVVEALARDASVVAFARKATTLEAHPRLERIDGDVQDPVRVAQAVRGVDAVCCALGAPPRDRSGVRTRGTEMIVRAMHQADVQRLVCLSAFGVAESRELLPASYRLLWIPLLLRHVYADHAQQEEVVRGSGLRWTLVRPSSFAPDCEGEPEHGVGRPPGHPRYKVGVGQVARFVLEALHAEAYVERAPYLTC